MNLVQYSTVGKTYGRSKEEQIGANSRAPSLLSQSSIHV